VGDKTLQEQRRELARAKATTAAENRAKAISLRREGYSFQKIADSLGISKQSAHRTWRRAMCGVTKITEDEAQAYIAEELERIDDHIVALRPIAKKGSHLASAELRALYKRRAILLGYEPPKKIAPTDPAGTRPYQPERTMPIAEASERIKELIKKELEASKYDGIKLP
jgi:hypothetical protein